MGKRELLIASAFIVVAVVAYQVAAPPVQDDQDRFSFSSLLATVRREARGNRAVASVSTRGTISVPDTTAELKVSGVTEVTITGDARDDIAYDLTVESNGPDEAAARDLAGRTTLAEDLLGPILALAPHTPGEGRGVVRVSLSVPARLGIHVESTPAGAKIEITDVASVRLGAIVGDVRLRRIAGRIAGSHRNGELSVSDAGSVNLTLVSSTSNLTGVRGAVTLSARNGRCLVGETQGPVEITVSNQDVTVDRPGGAVRLDGEGGRISVDAPRDSVQIDVRRARVDLTLTRPVAVTALTTDEVLNLRVAGPPPILLDARATDGGIVRADDFALSPTTAGEQSRISHSFGGGGAPVTLRNRRADIVINETK